MAERKTEANEVPCNMKMTDFVQLEKRPQYFSFFLECCDMISLLDETSAGRVIHAIADYFSYGDEPEGLTRSEERVFNRIKQDADNSCNLWWKKVQAGKDGAEQRWKEKL